MKYRRLTNEELKELEKEFINFLVANTITADDWLKIKELDPEKAEVLIEMFSDVVLDKVLRKVQFVEHRGERDLIIFNCGKDEIELFGLTVSEELEVDLTNEASVISMLLNSEMLDGNVKSFHQTKRYQKERELEVFEMIQSGCLITDDSIYNTLKGLY